MKFEKNDDRLSFFQKGDSYFIRIFYKNKNTAQFVDSDKIAVEQTFEHFKKCLIHGTPNY
jgi:hypothetical protein